MVENLVLLDRIDDNPFQIRQVYDEAGIAELAADIYARGLLQPPVGRQVGERVQLAFGHRRLRAYRHIVATIGSVGWQAMPVNVQVLSDEQMALYAWSENAQRKDITPIEEAQAIQRMMDGFGWSQGEVGYKLGVDRSTVANKLRLLRLPEDVQARVNAREVSERQAMALLPMLDLPKATLNAFEKSGYAYPKPSDVIKRAGNESSDRLRNQVQEVIEKATTRLDGRWSGHAFDDRYVKAPTCEACPETVRHGDGLRCPHRSCFDRKLAAWQALRLVAASEQTGIAIAGEMMQYGAWSSLANVPQPGKILERGCPNLRLRFNDSVGVSRLLVQDYDDVEIVCLHGKDGRCTCGQAAKAQATRQDPDHQARKAAEKRIHEEIVEPAVAAVLAGLEGGHLGVWRAIASNIASSRGDVAVKDGDDLSTIQAAMARGVAYKNAWQWKDKADFGQAKEVFERQLAALGLPLPWTVTPLEAAQRQYGRIAEWIQQRRFWKWDYELNVPAIAGNIANLERLQDEAAELPDGDETAALRSLIAQDLCTLRELAQIAGQLNEIRTAHGNLRQRCTELCEKEVGGLEFDRVLAGATAPELRYALVFSDSFGRIQALSARLYALEEMAPAVLQTGEFALRG